jgi:hypothetical protein
LATALGLVSKRFKKPLARSNIARILRNPFYYGVFAFKGELYQGSHSPIIDKDLFDSVQEILEFKSKPKLYKNRYFVLKGFIRCGECGCQITAQKQKGHNYYHCTKRKSPCSQSQYLREEDLARQIKQGILSVYLDNEIFSLMMNEVKTEIKLFEADKIHSKRTAEIKITEIEEKTKRLLDLYLNNGISEEEYKTKKSSLLNRKIELEQNPQNSDGKWLEQMKCFLTSCNQARYIAFEANPSAQKEFLQKIGSNFSLLDQKLYFSYKNPWKFVSEGRKEEMG